MSGNGWCTHPKRQVSSDVRILVRKGELACRNSWGGDLWTSAEAQVPASDPGPAAPGSAFIANEHTEDQVTSVRASGPSSSETDSIVFSEPSFSAENREDIIVDHASVRTNDAGPGRASRSRGDVDDDGLNVPAQEDQQERARIIARGSRDAILRARERHTQRRKGADRLHPPRGQDDTPHESEDSRVTPTGDQEQEAAAASDAGTASIAKNDDDMVGGNLRFGRRAHLTNETPERSDQKASVPAEFIRTYGDPTPPVQPDDVRRDPHNMVVRKTDRDRFETVPEIKPDIELPRIRQFLQTGEGAGKGIDPGAADTGSSTPVDSYDLVLRRAQAIKDASRTQRQGRGSGLPRKAPITPGAPTLPAEQTETRGRRSERVNHLPEIEWDVDADEADESFARGRLPDLDTDDIVSGRHHDDRARSHASDIDLPEVADNPAWDNDDDPRLDNDHDPFTRPLTTADHRQNWWRGLTFGRARNQPVHIGPDEDRDPYTAADADDWIEDEIDVEMDRAADTFHDDEFTDAVAEPAEPTVVRRYAATGLSAATSERRSGRPEPRRPSWEPFDESANTPLRRKRIGTSSPATVHSVDPERDRDRSTRGTRSVHAAEFALRDERGMDAFRSALFRDDHGPEGSSTTPAGQPDARDDETVAIRQPTATADARGSRRTSYRPLEEQVREPARLRHAPVERADDPFQDETFDIRDLVAHGDDVLDMTIELAPELPRMCQTCRDFRPSESGERGWCTNDWAFTHRQMVNAESLPCQSSIGCWWLPNDASWLPALDPSERKAPTPRIDRLVAQSRLHDISQEEEHQELYVREI